MTVQVLALSRVDSAGRAQVGGPELVGGEVPGLQPDGATAGVPGGVVNLNLGYRRDLCRRLVGSTPIWAIRWVMRPLGTRIGHG